MLFFVNFVNGAAELRHFVQIINGDEVEYSPGLNSYRTYKFDDVDFVNTLRTFFDGEPHCFTYNSGISYATLSSISGRNIMVSNNLITDLLLYVEDINEFFDTETIYTGSDIEE